jgi:transposase
MTRPLSNGLRERVVAAVLSGASSRQAAARFNVAVSSVVKLMQRWKARQASFDPEELVFIDETEVSACRSR